MKAKKGKGKKKEKVRNGGIKKAAGAGNSRNTNGEAPRPQKKSKGGSTIKGDWNLVPIGEECFTDKEFENLVSFEELLDYNVVTNEDGTKGVFVGETDESEERQDQDQGKKKRKSAKDEDDGDHELPVSPSKSKKRLKKGTEAEFDDKGKEVIFTSAGPVIVEEDAGTDTSSNKNPVKVKETKGSKTGLSKKVDSNPKKEEKQKNGTANKQNRKGKDVELKKCQDNIGVPEEDTENEEFEAEEWVKLGVPDIILKSLKEKKFNKPTNIQALTLPAAILCKKDIVGAAETGSGKTLAFAIPIIDGIVKGSGSASRASSEKCDEDEDEDENEDIEDDKHQSVKALILTPTRELAVQIKNHFDVAARYTEAKTVVIVGGLAAQKQERLLRSRPDVVIATPGRLWELLQEGDPHLSTLNQLKYLAIDETDRMVERGHFKELEGILNFINTHQRYKDKRQNFVFSATLAFTHEPPQRLKTIGNKKVKFMRNQPKKVSSKDKLKQIMEMVGVRPNPKIVDITTSKGTCETLTEMQITSSLDHKDYYLYYFLLCNPGRTIVFCNSINCVRRLTNLFYLLQAGEVLPLHAEMNQKMRLRNLERFTANEKGVLIATDVAARGLDIQNIQHVIHYQVPRTAESYIHRSGRTARAFKGGIAILMIEPAETTTVKNIFRSLGREEMLPSFNVDGKIFREIKNTVEMAIKVEQFEHSVRKQLADHNWMEKAKKDMDLASSSDDSDGESGGGTASQKKALMKSKKQLDNYKKQLSQMMLKNDRRFINKST